MTDTLVILLRVSASPRLRVSALIIGLTFVWVIGPFFSGRHVKK
jgi:hypothetical protein